MNHQSKLLVVDDYPDNVTFLSDALQAKGYTIITASSGGQALTMVENEHPDLVLLDLQMPVMTGMMALDYIIAEDPDAHVILLTSVTDTKVIYERFEAGAQYYLRKDEPPEKIKAALQEQLEKIKTRSGQNPD